MNKREILIICLLLCIICSISAVSAADVNADDTNKTLATSDEEVVGASNDLSVLSVSDDSDVLGDATGTGGSFSDLQTLINSNTGTITLTGNYAYGGSDSGNTGISIKNKDITIVGQGNIVIDAKEKSRIFNIDGATVILKGITFTNAKYSGDGGAITSNSKLIIDNCNFTSSSAISGGAILIGGSHTKITNSNFESNVASYSGNIWGGGAIKLAQSISNVTFDHCSFVGNNATNGHGGAITMSQCKNIVINNSYFNKNYAKGDGGALYTYKQEKMSILNTNFTENSVLYSTGLGGAIHFQNDNHIRNYIDIINCSFISNSAARGGAIRTTQPSYYFNLYNLTFKNNKAKYEGGAFSHNQLSYYFNFENITFVNSSTEQITGAWGGTIYFNAESSNWKNISIYDSESLTGGAICIKSSVQNTFHDIVIKNATAYSYGGAIQLGLYTSDSNNILANVTIIDSEVTDAWPNYGGGAIFIMGSSATLTNISITNTSSNSCGGAIQVYNSHSTLNNINITNSSARNGGAIYVGSDYQTIKNCNIKNSNATNYGGAIYVGENIYVYLTNLTINSTNAYNGGGVYYAGYIGSLLWINNCTLTNNNASHNGGAIYYVVSEGGSSSSVVYRDYDNFDKQGVISDGRTTVSMSSSTGSVYASRIYQSYFSNNNDYILNTSSTNDTSTIMGIVNISSPNDPNRNSFRIVINITNGDSLITQVILNTTSDFNTYFNNNFKKFIVNIRDNLTRNTKYNVTVGFEDSNYLYKESKSSFEIGNVIEKGDFLILQGLIDAVNSGGVLDLTRSYTFTAQEDYPELTSLIPDRSCMNITKPITINGNGFTLTALSYSRIFNITAGNVILNNINFIHGNASGKYDDGIDKGGAIYWDGSNGVINNSAIRYSYAEYGGGIYFSSQASDCNVTNDIFANNNATKNGGAIDCNATRMRLYNTTFQSNVAENGSALCREVSATGGSGRNNTFISNYATNAGAALAWMRAENIYIDTYTFIDNTADYSGGAIYVGIGSTNCTVFNSTFTGNNVTGQTNGHGGAIEWYADTGRVLNSTFRNNNAYTGGAIYVGSNSGHVNITNSGFIRNNAITLGGAIDLAASSVAVNNSYFRENTATHGGAIFVGGSSENSNNNYIYSSYFTDNNATGRGGAVDWNSTAGYVYKTNFTRNSAEYGGAVYVGGASPNSKIEDVIFTKNNATKNGGAIDWNATGGQLYNTQFISNYAGEYGAALCRESGATGGSGKNNTFKYNHADIAGAALAWLNVTGIHINDYKFYYNTANASGGAIYIGNGSDNCGINGSVFVGNNITNETGGHGGAIDIVADNANVTNSNFTNNKAFYGGAIFVGSKSGNTHIVNATFKENNATVDGGAINLQASGVTLNGTTFEWNIAQQNGGGVYVGGEGTTNKIYNSNFTSNVASHNGGAVYWRAYAGHIEYSNFTLNSATNGGAIYLNGVSSNTNITHVIFKENFATENGGAIDCNSTRMNLTYTLFDTNRALKYGAALCREKGATNGMGEYNNFTSNYAGIAGAALAWLDVENININHYIFTNNYAGEAGGAIYANSGSNNFTVNNCKFEGNNVTSQTSGHGGAIDVDSENNTIKNSNFTNNNAYDGGAIHVDGAGHINITNVTFDKNGAYHDGGAVNLVSSGVRLNDTRFYNNTATNNGGAVYVGGTGTTNVVFDSDFEENKAGNRGGAIDWLAQKGEIKNSNFTLNTAGDGGALYLNGASSGSELSHLIFKNNTATRNGGAIDCNATLVNLTHTQFISNVAEFGAALCREKGATGGFGVNNTFDKNHATKSGAALAWLGVENIHINNYTFTNNTADYSGGAIYVGPGSDNCEVVNCTFEDDYVSNAIAGRGGAIDWIGNNGTVKNTTFKRCISLNGGGIYIADTSDNMTIDNVSFTSCSSLTNGGAIVVYGDDITIRYTNFTSSDSKENGAAIAGFGSNNANISYCDFKYNLAAGYIDPNGVPHGEGGAIYWADAKNFNLANSTFLSNGAHLSGGTISADNCTDSKVYKISTHNETAATNGGSIAWINSDNVTIDLCFLDDPGAEYNGGAIYLSNVNATVKNSILNSTWAAWGTAGAIFVDGNVTINNVTFNDTHAMDDNATAIYFASGISTLSNSNFTDSYNSIGIAKGANVTLTKNNLTTIDPNKSIYPYLEDNSTLGVSKTKYSIWNDGDLYLEKNNFDYVIFNNGTIHTQTYMDILANDTWNVTWNTTFTFFANLTDDNNNTIISVKNLKTWNNESMGGYFNMSYNQFKTNTYYQANFIIYGSDIGLAKCTNRSGTINVKMPLKIELTHSGDPDGETVTVTATITPNYPSNYTLTGKVHFKMGDASFDATIIDGVAKWSVATSVWNLNNLKSGAHTVTATYYEDDHHLGASNDTSFDMNLRNSWVIVRITSVAYGSNATVNITTNSNGTVRFSLHGKDKVIVVPTVKSGENYTAEFNLTVANYTTVGKHSAGVVLEANEYYAFNMNQTTFEVYKLNTTIVATPDSHIKVKEKETITVQVNETATGLILITLNNGEEYYKKLNTTGGAKFSIAGLANGTYTGTVEYLGNEIFNGNSTAISFTVGETDDYNMTVLVQNITYGQNATIYIVLPSDVTNNLTVYINDMTPIENVNVTDGIAKVVVPNLDAGNYVVNVTYNGDEVYKSKSNNGTEFNVESTSDWALNLTVDAHKHGDNTIFTVIAPANLKNSLNFTIDGHEYTLAAGNTLTLNNLTAGLHTASVKYDGDDRYSAKTNSTNFLVDKENSTVELTRTGENLIATVTAGATGNVTFYVNGKVYTKDVNNNQAILENALLYGNNTVIAVYNGDVNFTTSKDSKNYTKDLEDSLVNVTATNETYGKASEIVVQVPKAQSGYVTITVNDTLVNVTVKIVNGEAKFNATGLDVGRYRVNVTYLGDSTYGTKDNYTYFNITKNNNLGVDVIGQNVTVKENASFVINISDDFKGKVNITIGGISYYDGDVKSLVTIDKLDAGTYTATVKFYGSDNYGNKTLNDVSFTVSRVVPTINVTIDDVTYPTKSIAIVDVSDYANGTINITVGDKYFNETITNGHVEIDLTGLSAGVKDASVNFTTSDKYNFNSTVKVKFNINKKESSVIITQNGQNIIATVPADATGNVTFFINGKKYSKEVSDGKAILENALLNGKNSVVAIYSGDKNFTSAFNATNNTAGMKDANVSVSATSVVYGNDSVITVKVPAAQQGYVRVVINGTEIDVVLEINGGTATFNASDLNAGRYRVNVTYLGDGTYGIKENYTYFNITKANLTASVIAQNVTVVENGSFIITVLNDFSGNVSIEVDGVKYNGTVKTLIETAKLIKGSKTATVTFYGDDNYNIKVICPTFTVSAVEPTINVTITDTTYPNDATATVKVSGGANGTIEIKVGTHTYSKEIRNGETTITLDGLDAGLHEAIVNFTSTDDYNLNANSTYKFFINKTQSHIQINVTPKVLHVGDIATLNITVSCTGEVIVYIDGNEASRTLDQNRIILDTSKLTVGKHNVVVYYPGDVNYESSSDSYTFTVEPLDAKVNVSVENTPYREVAEITVQTPANQTGYVTIDVGGKNYTAKLEKGIAKFNVTGLTVDEYTVDVTYNGDENYTVQTNDTTFSVTQINLNPSVLGVNVTDAMNSTFIIVVPEDYEGQVTITVGGETRTGDVASIIQMAKLTAGEKEAHVVFSDDTNYKGTELDVTFNVTKADKYLPVTTVVNSTTVVVTVPENVTGNVTVVLPNGTNKTVNVTNGSAIITIENMTPGVNNITVIYKDGNNTITTNATVTIPKYDSEMDVKVTEVVAGGNATVTVEVPKNATGTITVTIDGKKYTTDEIVEGKATLTVENLTAGDKTLIVEYSGDANYTANYTLANFTVAPGKVESEIIVVDHGNGTVVVVVGGNATGNVTITVDGQNFTADVVNGTAIVNVTDITPGVHEVEVIYSGDSTHTNSTTSTNITGPKYDSEIKVEISEVKAGESTTVTVYVPVNATGNVTVTIDGKTYTTDNITDGKAVITTENLTAGDKTLIVEYSGDANYTANYTLANFTVAPGKVESEIIVVDHGNGTVVVVVGGNATGNVTITVDGQNFTADVVNGTAIVNVTDITPGVHEVEVIYSGDSTHTNATASTNITGPKYDSEINVTIGEAKEGEPIMITVEVPVGATGEVVVYVGGENHTATIDPQTGKATVTVDNISGGNHTIAVEYSGDDNYAANYTVSNMTVQAGKVESDLTVVDYGNGTVVVVVGDNATGNVTVKVGDNTYNATVVNGTAVVYINNETPGIHEIEVVYSGDDTHANATATANITAPKYDTSMNVTVGEAKEGEPIVITVEVPVGATGEVVVYVGGENHTATIDPQTGKATVTVDNISGGNHTIAVEYSGDDNYAANYTVSNMTVEAGKVDSDLTVVDYGNGTVVVVVGDNATGNVTVKIGNETYNATVINSTAVITLDNATVGEHNITIIYSGDDTHTNATVNTTITVKDQSAKKDTPIKVDVKNINVGDIATVEVTLPDGISGEVTVEIDGVKYTKQATSGKVTFEIENLTAGIKSVFATYAGDDTYAANYTSGQFNVSKVEVNISVEITNIKVGENATITITLPKDATGQILIDIDGIGYYANATEGIAVATIPYLPSGTYDVALTYTGDEKYMLASNKTTLKVEKIPSFVIPIASNIDVGENEVIKLIVPSDATGNVTVVIDGEEYNFNLQNGALGVVYSEGEKYTVAISGGNGELTVSGLPKGEYTVSVKYNGDKKYLPSTNSTIFTVSKIDTSIEVVDQGNGTVVVILPEDATGNVTITVENQTYAAEVVNGTATVTINNTSPGTHDIVVDYSGDRDYSSKSINSTVDIPKYETPISVSVDDIKVGETAEVIVSLPDKATGKVTIEINGVEYTGDAKDGKATFEVEGLAYGNKTVAVTYEGDSSYVENFTTGQFEVAKNPSTIKATSKNINVGKDEVISVKVPSDATGRVLIDIDGVGYYADIVNGNAKVIIPNLEAGKYRAAVTYEGDDKYQPSSTEVTFTVSKLKAPISATGDEVKQGEDGTVIVKLPEDATGTVTVVVNGKTYTEKVENGQAIFTVPGLNVGDHDVTAYYSGDAKYDANTTITDIIVIPAKHDGNNTGGHSGISLASHATGNPIFVLLFIILAMGSTQLRRFRK